MLQSLRDLHDLGIEVYFEQENLWLNEQQIQILLAAYCALAQAKVRIRAEISNGGSSEGLKTAAQVTLSLCALATSEETMDNW